MKRTSVSRYPIFASVVLAIVLGFGLDKVFDALVSDDNSSHAAEHLTYSIPALLLAFLLIRFCPPPKGNRVGQWSRRTSITGLLLLGVGATTEAIGAFGERGDVLSRLHNLVTLIAIPALLMLLIGVALGVISVFQRNAFG